LLRETASPTKVCQVRCAYVQVCQSIMRFFLPVFFPPPLFGMVSVISLPIFCFAVVHVLVVLHETSSVSPLFSHQWTGSPSKSPLSLPPLPFFTEIYSRLAMPTLAINTSLVPFAPPARTWTPPAARLFCSFFLSYSFERAPRICCPGFCSPGDFLFLAPQPDAEFLSPSFFFEFKYGGRFFSLPLYLLLSRLQFFLDDYFPVMVS